MSRGGRREGSGRKVGSKNKNTIEREERARLEFQREDMLKEARVAPPAGLIKVQKDS